jgi:hypothetical protein
VSLILLFFVIGVIFGFLGGENSLLARLHRLGIDKSFGDV